MASDIKYMVVEIECMCGFKTPYKISFDEAMEGRVEVACKVCGIIDWYYVAAELNRVDEETYSWKE